MKAEIDTINLPDGYAEWRSRIEKLIEKAKLNAAIHVNTDMLSLYWSIGSDIIRKKKRTWLGIASNRAAIRGFNTQVS